jgi:hypothetical protein
METVDGKTLLQLNAINKWLGDVFGINSRLSMLLNEAGLSEVEIATIKIKFLERFINSMVDLIVDNTAGHDGERSNSVMVRRYGLLNGKPEKLQTIGNSLELSRERIRQLVQRRIRYYRNARRKEQFKNQLATIAREFLNSQ